MTELSRTSLYALIDRDIALRREEKRLRWARWLPAVKRRLGEIDTERTRITNIMFPPLPLPLSVQRAMQNSNRRIG
jgi:hypothetical protein